MQGTSEQQGIAADIIEDAVEIFFKNEATVWERLWQYVREQLEKQAR